jgi:hypothetical protein
MTSISKTMQWLHAMAHMCAPCCAILLTAACTGGGLVYRPDPEPRQEFPVDISIEQKIYTATAKQPPKAATAAEPVQTKTTARSASTQAADHFYSVHLFSFKQPDLARRAAQNLAEQTGQPVFVREADLPGSGIWHRVYIGMFPSEAAAKAFGGTIKSDGISDYFCVYKLSAPLATASQPRARPNQLTTH